MDTETHEDRIVTLLQRIRDRLEAERRRVSDEISNYPSPIPACDAQFNHLLEERDRIVRELQQVNEQLAGGATAPDALARIDGFLAASCSITGELEREIRSSFVDLLGDGVPVDSEL